MRPLLLFVTACGLFAQVPRPQEYPPSFFTTKDAAVSSAEKAFAGGGHQEMLVGKKKVLVLYHYASGIISTDAAIYVESSGSWRLIAYYAPILNDSIVASVDGDVVVLRAPRKKQLLLTVSVAPPEK